MKKIAVTFLSATGLILSACVDSIVHPSSETNKQKLSYAFQHARDVQLVDVPLKKLYRYYGGNDHMDRAEPINVPPYALQGMGWYVLNSSVNTTLPTNPLYSLYHPTLYNHMTSIVNVSGHTNEFQFGKTFAHQDLDLGIFPIRQYYKTWFNPYRVDHMTAFDNEVPSGYSFNGTLGYGWPTRIGAEPIANVTKDNFTIGTSRSWGGSIVSLKRGSLELVNRYDAGREIQSAMWYGLAPMNWDNPTEAGDMYSNGSPVINYDLNYPSAGGIRTQSLALNWGENRSDISKDAPMLSGTQFLKKVQIESSQRIRHEVTFIHAKNPSDIANGPQFAWHEPLACYLVDGVFNRIQTFNWNGSSWTSGPWGSGLDANVNDNPPSGPVYHAPNGNATYILAYNTTTNLGFAIFRKNPTPWNSSTESGTHFGTFRHLCANSGGSNVSNQTLKITVGDAVIPFSKGSTNTYVHYILIGTFNEIRAQAESLR